MPTYVGTPTNFTVASPLAPQTVTFTIPGGIVAEAGTHWNLVGSGAGTHADQVASVSGIASFPSQAAGGAFNENVNLTAGQISELDAAAGGTWAVQCGLNTGAPISGCTLSLVVVTSGVPATVDGGPIKPAKRRYPTLSPLVPPGAASPGTPGLPASFKNRVYARARYDFDAPKHGSAIWNIPFPKGPPSFSYRAIVIPAVQRDVPRDYREPARTKLIPPSAAAPNHFSFRHPIAPAQQLRAQTSNARTVLTMLTVPKTPPIVPDFDRIGIYENSPGLSLNWIGPAF